MTTAAFSTGAQLYASRPLCIDVQGHRYRPANEALTHAMCERCGDVVATHTPAAATVPLGSSVLTTSIGGMGDVIPSREGQKY